MAKMIKPKSRKPRARRAQATTRATGMGGQDRVNGHVSMVLDPCRSLLKPTAYRGQDGFLQRFSSAKSYSPGGTFTTFIIAYDPAYNTGYQVNLQDAATSVVLSTFPDSGISPGQAYLLQNAGAMRPVAACVDVTYSGSELNRRGTMHVGVIKASMLDVSTTAAQFITLMSQSSRTPDHALEVKWSPSPADEEYWQVSSVSPPNRADRNIVMVVGTGFTDNTIDILVRSTLISEWQPKAGLGFQALNPSSADSVGGLERVRSMLASYNNWWTNASGVAAEAALAVRNTTRAIGAGVRVGRAVATRNPLLLMAR